jgi:hypothetical protein
MRPRIFVALVLLAGIAAACAGDSPTNPSSPPNSPTLISVTVAGALSLVTNQTSQFTATAYFAKGTGQNVTSQATWSSTNTAVATVSAAGLVTCVGTGTAEIRATYLGVSDGALVTVTRPPTYALSGTVTETAPHLSTTLTGVRVEITDGANQGRFATTEATGQYQFANLSPGTFSVKAQLDAYDDTTKSVTVSGNTTLNLTLNPTLTHITETFNKQISAGDPPCYVGLPCQVFAIPLHNTGALEATLTWGSAVDAYLALQLYSEDTGRVLAQSDSTTSASQFVSANMSTPGSYQLRVVALRITKITPFTLTTKHTN